MPEPRSAHSNPDTTDQEPGSADHQQPEDRDARPPPPQDRHDDAPPDRRDERDREPEYTGRDWRDDQGGRGAPTPPDASGDRDDHDDREDERPRRVGTGPATTVGRSSSWGPVLSGAATAFVVFLIFSALWVAIAASGARAVGDNLAWFQLISGILAAAAGGAAAGWLDPRGTLTGMVQGLSTWGLLVLATTITGLATGTALLGTLGNVTLEANVDAANMTEMLRPFETELWALFAVLLGGASIAALAGALTGRAHTPRARDGQASGDDTGAARR